MAELTALNAQEWDVRRFIYEFSVENQRPPTNQNVAEAFSIGVDEARSIFQKLNGHHHIFLEAGTDQIRMANPLSAVPTLYRVRVKGKDLWANCAWDSLGIAAMVGADAEIEAVGPLSGEILRYGVRNGQLDGPDYVVHFSLPAEQWYDDLIHT